MATWILIAIFGAIAITAGLVAILQCVNAKSVRDTVARGEAGAMIPAVGGDRRDPDGQADSGDNGGGDGGGGD